MTDFETVDYFTDQALVPDPYEYFEHLRADGPVVRLPHHGVVVVTGYDEALQVYRDTDTFSSCNAVTGPFPGLPLAPDGDDATAIIEEHRHSLPMSEYIVTQDPPEHGAQRGLLMRLLTPKRMAENEAFMWRLADAKIDEFIGNGTFEVLGDYAHPFALLVIADLLGVPEEDHQAFTVELGQLQGAVAGNAPSGPRDPLAFLFDRFTSYVEDRRREPRNDVLTQLATVTYPDGSLADVDVVVRTAAFLFGAGQDTTTRLVSWSLRVLAEDPELQALLRTERERIPNFIEEMLRIESPVKSDFRMARRRTTLAGVDIPGGATVMILPGAANRDPRRFECPAEIRPDRPNANAHVSFGRGVHSCPGGPLSRIEARVSVERVLDRFESFRISEAHHGPTDARRYDLEPTYILRGLKALHLDFTPADAR